MLLETVPNFSEGRDQATIRELGEALATAGARVVDLHVDHDHHRCVYSVFGQSEQLAIGLRAAVAVAVERIDLSRHRGVHPRIGACDVLPIVPMHDLAPEYGADATAAAELATDVAARVGGLGVPVIRYGHGAGAVAGFAGAVRRGGDLALAARIASGELQVAAGPQQPHPTAGAILVGVRDVLVAFNVDLVSDDVSLARSIAVRLRESGGGVPGVRALGLQLEHAGRVQVSTNVERWREAGPAEVLRRVAEYAEESGVRIARCELVGLAPGAVLEELALAREQLAQADGASIELAQAAEPRLEVQLDRAREALG